MAPLIAMVSYQSSDLAAAELLHEELALRGLVIVRDRQTFVDGQRIEAEIGAGVATCDAFVVYLTPNSLYLDSSPNSTRPVIDFELKPAMQRRRDHKAFLANQGVVDDRVVRPVVVPVLYGLGDPRTQGVEKVRSITGENIGSLWCPAVDQTGPGLTQGDAAKVARRVLASLISPGSQQLDGHFRLVVATRGTGQAPTGDLNVDGIALMGGEERRPGIPQDWDRFLIGLRDLESTLAKHSSSRRLDIVARTHLTGAIALGRVFNQGAGWTIVVTGRYGEAKVTDHTASPDLYMSWDSEDLGSDALVVEIDLLGHPVFEMTRSLISTMQRPIRGRLQFSCKLRRDLEAGEISTMAAAAAAQIRQKVAECRPKHVHLTCASPADFAVLLGHKLTSLYADLHLYERDEDFYIPSLVIPRTLP